MLAELQEQYNQLEASRLALVRKVCALDPDILCHKPDPERWSILEEFQHLVLAEQKTPLEYGPAMGSEAQNPEMLEMVLQVLDQDVVVEVPDPAMVPDGDATLDELILDWEASRTRLSQLLEACGPDDLQSPVSRHPVTGPLTVGECLRLIASHVGHHCRRIDAVLTHQRGNP